VPHDDCSRAVRALEALRRPLAYAARDGFARLPALTGLLGQSAEAARRLARSLQARGSSVARVVEELERFAAEAVATKEDEEQRTKMLVGLGLRLCARVAFLLEEEARDTQVSDKVAAPPCVPLAQAFGGLLASTAEQGGGSARREAAPKGDALPESARRRGGQRAAAPKGDALPESAQGGSARRVLGQGGGSSCREGDQGRRRRSSQGKVGVECGAEDPLAAPLWTLPGCGKAFASRFAERGVTTVGDLLFFFPAHYEDRRSVVPLPELDALPDGARVTTRGTVLRINVLPKKFADLIVTDGEARVVARWFRMNPGLGARFRRGDRVLLSGVLRRFGGTTFMPHPDVCHEAEASAGVMVWYPEVEGVPRKVVARLCRDACARYADLVPDGLPEEMRQRLGLVAVADALRAIHLVPDDIAPSELEALSNANTPAYRRLIFDEFFFLQLGLARRRMLWRKNPAPSPAGPVDPFAEMRPFLGFEPTRAQEQAAREIVNDMARAEPMNRLLQGDVGCGKTVVAFAAVLAMRRAGYQSALMAPTEILAEQHFRTMQPWASCLGVRIAMLSAQTPKGARESILALLAGGALDLLIGTHALLDERVAFNRLGLVIVDEQHRFGVAQRARLRHKASGELPHLLVMTATPIPRTLALTVYGDLDVTIIDEMPPGRRPPTTRLLRGKKGWKEALQCLSREVAAGKQAFVVCPRIDAGLVSEDTQEDIPPPARVRESGTEEERRLSEKVDPWADAVRVAQELSGALPEIPMGLLHSRLPLLERERVMARFREGKDAVLVATTMIEVGVDVPRATLMVVMAAERFGLAQLHQLRGRVGRGGGEASCLLVCSEDASPEALSRLEVLCATSDGFRIAEADLAMRGPGEFVGTRQAGMPRLRFGDLARHADLLRLARAEAFALIERDPELEADAHRVTRRVLEERWDPRVIVAADSG